MTTFACPICGAPSYELPPRLAERRSRMYASATESPRPLLCAVHLWERLTAACEPDPNDGLAPYRADATPEERAACPHPPDDRAPLSGDGWLCTLCGADCGPPKADRPNLNDYDWLRPETGPEPIAVPAGSAGPAVPGHEVRRPRDPAAVARLGALFAAAPPEWQELFAELDRRDPKMAERTANGGIMSNASEGMRIEKREDGEWLVGAPEQPNDCQEVQPGGGLVCCVHHDGFHISGCAFAPDGALRILARWPIAAEVEDAEGERPAGIHELWNASRGVRVFAPVDAKPLEVLAVVAELLGLRPVPTVPGEPTAEERAAIEAGKRGPFIPHAEVERTLAQRAHAAGIVEGLRVAKLIARGLYKDDRFGASELGALDGAIDEYVSGTRFGARMRIVHDRTSGQWWEPVTGPNGRGRVLRPVAPLCVCQTDRPCHYHAKTCGGPAPHVFSKAERETDVAPAPSSGEPVPLTPGAAARDLASEKIQEAEEIAASVLDAAERGPFEAGPLVTPREKLLAAAVLALAAEVRRLREEATRPAPKTQQQIETEDIIRRAAEALRGSGEP